MANESAIIDINPEADITILSLLSQANRLRDFAEARIIATDADLEAAVNDLAIIARVKKALAEKKAEYYKPIKAHLDAITASFQTLTAPIEAADKITRDKWQAYRNEQARRKAEADKINQDKIALAQREATFNGTGETTVDLTPVAAPAPIAKVRTDLGTAQTTTVRKWRLVDIKLVPAEYLMVNEPLVGRVVRSGLSSIPGIEVYTEESLRVIAR